MFNGTDDIQLINETMSMSSFTQENIKSALLYLAKVKKLDCPNEIYKYLILAHRGKLK